MTRTERLLHLARLRGDRAAELIVKKDQCRVAVDWCFTHHVEDTPSHWYEMRNPPYWTEAELRAAWGDR